MHSPLRMFCSSLSSWPSHGLVRERESYLVASSRTSVPIADAHRQTATLPRTGHRALRRYRQLGLCDTDFRHQQLGFPNARSHPRRVASASSEPKLRYRNTVWSACPCDLAVRSRNVVGGCPGGAPACVQESSCYARVDSRVHAACTGSFCRLAPWWCPLGRLW